MNSKKISVYFLATPKYSKDMGTPKPNVNILGYCGDNNGMRQNPIIFRHAAHLDEKNLYWTCWRIMLLIMIIIQYHQMLK